MSPSSKQLRVKVAEDIMMDQVKKDPSFLGSRKSMVLRKFLMKWDPKKTVEQLAKVLKVSKWTIRDYATRYDLIVSSDVVPCAANGKPELSKTLIEGLKQLGFSVAVIAKMYEVKTFKVYNLCAERRNRARKPAVIGSRKLNRLIQKQNKNPDFLAVTNAYSPDLTIEEMMAKSGMSKSTVYYVLHSRKLPFKHVQRNQHGDVMKSIPGTLTPGVELAVAATQAEAPKNEATQLRLELQNR